MTHRWAWCWVALTPLIFIVMPVRHTVESSMLLHMLVQFPLLLASGAASGRLLVAASASARRAWTVIDHGGLLGMVILSAVSALWMVPAALDATLTEPGAAALKYTSWWLAGLALALSWRRMSDVLRLFLLGSLAWMFATAGLLFFDSEQRLCVNYRLDEQAATGMALLALSGLLFAGLVASGLRQAALRTGSAPR